jgi:hypothetical protein
MSNELSSVLAAHIAGLYNHRTLGGVLNFGFVSRAQARRAHDMHLPCLGREPGKGDGRHRRGEVDDAVSLCKQRRGIAGELDAILRKAGEDAGVPAKQRRTRVLEGARKRKILAISNRLDQRAAHPPASAGDLEPHLGHRSNSGSNS